jgi:hypothetical protein
MKRTAIVYDHLQQNPVLYKECVVFMREPVSGVLSPLKPIEAPANLILEQPRLCLAERLIFA